MKDFTTASTIQHQDDECHPLRRAASVIGIGLILVGPVLPHAERWTMFGVALIAVSYLY